MDPITAFILGYIAKVLNGAVLPYLSQKAIPELVGKIKEKRETVALNSPEMLRALIDNGVVKTGQFVEGTAFFTPFSESHNPAVPLQLQMDQFYAGAMEMIQTQGRARVNPLMYALPTTRFPLVDDNYRVGFLYPENMQGFGIPLAHDGTVKTLPYLGKLICILKLADMLSIENCIVKYRGKVLTIPKSDVLAVFPGLTDDVYEGMLRAGRLNFLSLIEEGTYIEFFCHTPRDVIVGSHFIETHWEVEQLTGGKDFGLELDAAITEACRKVDFPPPQYYLERVKKVNVWIGGNYSFTQPRGVPYFNFQALADLKQSEVALYNKRIFDSIASSVINQMQDVYKAGASPKDLNATNDYKSPSFTILQSTSARSIEDPVYKSIRRWLEQRSPQQQAEKK